MKNKDHFLDDARKCFQIAGKVQDLKDIEKYASMGREYLRLAHDSAKVEIRNELDAPTFWTASSP
jgi:hypothetical protein